MSPIGGAELCDAFGTEPRCGRYAFESKTEAIVEARDGNVKSNPWFKSPSLNKDLIERIHRVRLVTKSRDQGWATSVSSGNWTWFELGIAKSNDTSNGRVELRWTSHENRFLTNGQGWREGNIFNRHHDLLKSLEDGDSIEVRVCARFRDWKNHAEKGYLVLDIGCETFNRKPFIFSQPNPVRFLDVLLSEPDRSALLQFLGGDHNQWKVLQTPTGPSARTGEAIVLASNTETNRILHINTPYGSDLRTTQDSENTSSMPRLDVIDADDLRREGFNIHRLSWDQTVEDIWNLKIKYPFHLLIRLGCEGAIYQRPGEYDHPLLIYEPESVEGHFLQSYSDRNLEFLAVDRETLKAELKTAWIAGLTASLAKESDCSIKKLCETQIKEAVTTGLSWSRRVAAIKYPKVKARKPGKPTWHNIKYESDADPVLMPVPVSGLEENAKSSLIFKSLPYEPKLAARDIVKKGLRDVLPFIPTARFGDLVAADRDEVDGFRKIANAIEVYLGENKTKPKPLSIAVFGQPGSGKSFGVKHVIRTILKSHGRATSELEFNLSQFQEESNLQTAFETIRDESMSGKMPIVFFDEFDATFKQQPLYWLSHFLAPIEDGISLLGDKRRALGKAIYIFIGGTEKTFTAFKDRAGQQDASSNVNTSIVATSLKSFLPSDLSSLVDMEPLSYTLSPSWDYSTLQGIFYQIRDFTSSGKIPIVFFRDFDTDLQSEPLGWLKYFLAPMQDGKFFDNGHYRPLGRAIFVFVGSASSVFMPVTGDTDVPVPVGFKNAKGPDFVSRLRGYVKEGYGNERFSSLKNVVTGYAARKSESKPLSLAVFGAATNRQRFTDGMGGSVDIRGLNQTDERDEMYTVRRAIVLRSMLERLGPSSEQPIQIEDGVLSALLYVPEFRHNARSLEAIIAMSSTSPGQTLGVNDLPPNDQLELHVDTEKFHRIRIAGHKEVRSQPDIELRKRYADIEWLKRTIGRNDNPENL
ncbi:hypothetical protein F4804DRAFT_326086 [Jackrogersella minutella]|nr:hypothetical protein F4804DRAFT_326086 [Jackrogersella minutella]